MKKDKLFISTSAVGIYDNKAKYDENGSFQMISINSLPKLGKEAQKSKKWEYKSCYF